MRAGIIGWRDERPRREGIETSDATHLPASAPHRYGEMNVPDERGLKLATSGRPLQVLDPLHVAEAR